ncbi:hypothetical protein [Halopseudomonas salegens]|uniref:Cytochrome c domain-containing protein n=1 Tax=Halopseudomonas salegens TaxID=1434072 RepID=A0A1H2ER51_9GAMM|nr:hypothetical protein [Halopseudomonas salegens]SDT97616.1 hypothetical protein SAMN05216210_0968 [Halopseudomonas salegens]
MRARLIMTVLASLLLYACGQEETNADTHMAEAEAAVPASDSADNPETQANGTCTGTYPSYWQDPNFPDMYESQLVSNQPGVDYKGPVFQLSDAFPAEPVDERADQPWRSSKFDAMFDPETDQATREALALEYGNLVLAYIQEGNIDSGDINTDWDVCNNQVRSWYNIPFQTYDVMSGREFTHGLTREAPVNFSMNTSPDPLNGTMWAVGFFNPTAAYTLGTIWKADGTPEIPTDNVSFADGAVIGKPLFTTLSPQQMPMLENLPAWQANISSPDFCSCQPASGNGQCTMAEQSQQCPRSLNTWGPVTLLQFDIAVKDSRAEGTQWVFGTFVADGQRKAEEQNPWKRISPLGLMWGNSTPPADVLASSYPDNPRENGFKDMVIFWDTVDMLNADGGANAFAHPGHLGCNSRLDGPADKAYSSCMSCHGTASVADQNNNVPPIAAQFGGLTSECALQDSAGNWIDASGAPAQERKVGDTIISYPQIDSIYFASTPAAEPYNTTVQTENGPVNILPGQPDYADSSRTRWISLDYSLQTSISIVQWQQWQQHAKDPEPAHKDVHEATLPRR